MVNLRTDLPKEALEYAKHTVTTEFGDRKSLGFVVDKPNGCQTAFMLLNAINDYLAVKNDLSIALYTNMTIPPCIIPFTSVYSDLELMNHRGALIACDIPSIFKAQHVLEARLYYYVYDPLYLKMINKQTLEYLENMNMTLIIRNQYHLKFIKDNFKFKNVSKIMIPEFIMEKFNEFTTVA